MDSAAPSGAGPSKKAGVFVDVIGGKHASTSPQLLLDTRRMVGVALHVHGFFPCYGSSLQATHASGNSEQR